MTDTSFIVDFEPIGSAFGKTGHGFAYRQPSLPCGICWQCAAVRVFVACRVRWSAESLPVDFLRKTGFGCNPDGSRIPPGLPGAALSDVRLEVPPESLPKRAEDASGWHESDLQIDPIITSFDLMVNPPDLHDLRSDLTRVLDVLERGATGRRYCSSCAAFNGAAPGRLAWCAPGAG